MTTDATGQSAGELITDLAPILDRFGQHHPREPVDLLVRAFETAQLLHSGQTRKSGEPYITHPLAVAHILAGYGMDAATLAAALLHDTVEDTEFTIEAVTDDYGETVAALIDGVTKLDRVKFSNREDQQAATIRKMVMAMARDVRVLVIKLVDRLHNIRTIHPLRPEKQQRIAAETLEVYAPLAHRLGVQEIKHEMEDRCFAILHPLRYEELVGLLRARGTFDEIHDLLGIRIVTKEVADCYAALGIVHTRWPPVQGRFKDYIAMPKFNLYQSLHTTLVGVDGKPLEVQIRTSDMHERAEHGVAAHWAYKEGEEKPEQIAGVSELSEITDDFENPAEFLASLKLDLYQDEVFVLTPKGDVKGLPGGATAIDFAYAVHTDVGHRTTGAKVNGRLVPLATKLESGDIVEVITSKSGGPSRDWLGFVRTSRASAKIRQWFSRERREQSLSSGRDQVAKLLRKEGLGLTASDRDELLAQVSESLGYRGLETLYVAVGDGNVHPQTVLNRLVRLVRPEEDEAEDFDPAAVGLRKQAAPSGGVVVEGMEDMWVRIARCCAPVPGDDIVGFVTVGRGVSVHRSDCTNIGDLSSRMERMVDVDWGAGGVGTFAAWIQVESLDRPRLLRDVTTALADVGANIIASSSTTSRERVAVLRFEIELSDVATLDHAIDEVRSVDGVYDAYRLLPGGGIGES